MIEAIAKDFKKNEIEIDRGIQLKANNPSMFNKYINNDLAQLWYKQPNKAVLLSVAHLCI